MKSGAKDPAAGKAGIARLLAIEHNCPGAPEKLVRPTKAALTDATASHAINDHKHPKG